MRRVFVVVTVGCAWSVALAWGANPGFTHIDLAPHANQKLTDDFHGLEGNTLKVLPQGEQILEGVPFQIGDSAIQLSGEFVPDSPDKAEGIQVSRAFTKLHILHATGWGDPDDVADGTDVGEYLVHFDNQSVQRIPVVYGRDIRDWWNTDNSKDVTRGKVAWRGANDAAKQSNASIRLYVTTWENPNPELAATRIDYISLKTMAAPFCVAMTLEGKK